MMNSLTEKQNGAYRRYRALLQLVLITNAIRGDTEGLEPYLKEFHGQCLETYLIDSETISVDHCCPLPPPGEWGINLYNPDGSLNGSLPYHCVPQLVAREFLTDVHNLRIWECVREYLLPETDQPRLNGLKTIYANRIIELENLRNSQ